MQRINLLTRANNETTAHQTSQEENEKVEYKGQDLKQREVDTCGCRLSDVNRIVAIQHFHLPQCDARE